jgi:hypothetical protein
MSKTKTGNAAFDATEGPGLRRLRASPKAEAIREATLADQRSARAKADNRRAKAPQAAPAAQEAPKAQRKAKVAPAPARGVAKAAYLMLWNPKYYDPKPERAAFAAEGRAVTDWRCANRAAMDGDEVFLVRPGVGLVAQGKATGWTDDRSESKIDLDRMRGLGDDNPPLVPPDKILAIPRQFWRPRVSGIAIRAKAAQALRRLAEAV